MGQFFHYRAGENPQWHHPAWGLAGEEDWGVAETVISGTF
ncbi:hypothetical protein L581_0939 [Serratia fonticola AU-AP2C]|nr:hypothetical protein L581_0939 [Serratia fonticola AU-AP2C]